MLRAAITLVNGRHGFAYSPETKTYHQSQASSDLLRLLLASSKHALSRLPLSKAYDSVTGVVDDQPVTSSPLAASAPLSTIIERGVKDRAFAPRILEIVMEELAAQTERPVLVAVDSVQALYRPSDYRDPSFNRVDSFALSLPRLLLRLTTAELSLVRPPLSRASVDGTDEKAEETRDDDDRPLLDRPLLYLTSLHLRHRLPLPPLIPSPSADRHPSIRRPAVAGLVDLLRPRTTPRLHAFRRDPPAGQVRSCRGVPLFTQEPARSRPSVPPLPPPPPLPILERRADDVSVVGDSRLGPGVFEASCRVGRQREGVSEGGRRPGRLKPTCLAPPLTDPALTLSASSCRSEPRSFCSESRSGALRKAWGRSRRGLGRVKRGQEQVTEEVKSGSREGQGRVDGGSAEGAARLVWAVWQSHCIRIRIARAYTGGEARRFRRYGGPVEVGERVREGGGEGRREGRGRHGLRYRIASREKT